MGTYFSRSDLEILRALRATLIGMEERPAGTRAPGYWGSARDLELYDRVFAARIGWKWDAVLDELERRELLPAHTAPPGTLPEVEGRPWTLLDWGTGTGIATRRLLARTRDRAGALPTRVVLVDRDERARAFAAESIAAEFPDVEVVPAEGGELDALTDLRVDVAVASHVLDELEEDEVPGLLAALSRADEVVWVEPGSRATSRRLSAAREELMGSFHVVAPCTHGAACGILADGRERDWCHLFARPPAEVHTTGAWSEVRRELRIDLRSLPYSFLALRRQEAAPVAGARLLGRPRFQKGRVLLDVCDAAGVRHAQMLQRSDKALFKELKSTEGETVVLEIDGSSVRRVGYQT
ncbi:MAG: small ribosomal subunit Rsm22 family protein [Planctomycetota bacterium]